MKKKDGIKIVIIVAALSLAVVVYVHSQSSSPGIAGYKGQVVYLKCSNPNCGYVWKMDKGDYFQMIHEKYHDEEKPVACPKCGSSAYRAVKCPKCGKVFIRSRMQADGVVDRCPQCGYSEAQPQGRQRR